MSDPRKPIRTTDEKQRNEILGIVHRRLMLTTEVGAREIGATGASFVIIGLGVWAAELVELDAQAAASLLRALADIYDPRSSENKKHRAEKDRSQAVRSLLAALDLEMAKAAGNG